MTKHNTVIENICAKIGRFSFLASPPEHQDQNPFECVTGMKILKLTKSKLNLKEINKILNGF